MVKADQGENFASEFAALANGYNGDFGGKAKFIYTLPGKELASKITTPTAIKGESAAIPISSWQETGVTQELLDQITKAAAE